MSHHEEEGSRHGYDAELIAEEICRHMANWMNRNLQGEKVTPTREQIASVLWKAAMLPPDDGFANVLDFARKCSPNKLADALLREYEIRVKEEKNG